MKKKGYVWKKCDGCGKKMKRSRTHKNQLLCWKCYSKKITRIPGYKNNYTWALTNKEGKILETFRLKSTLLFTKQYYERQYNQKLNVLLLE